MKKRWKHWKRWAVTVIVTAPLAFLLIVLTYPPGPAITISKETTFFTEPLRPDGTVDYLAAVNRWYSKGVTPENNAAVFFWKVAGPSKITLDFEFGGSNKSESDVRKDFFEKLGIPPMPKKGGYFVTWDEFSKGLPDAERPISAYEAFHRPWSKEEFPGLAKWIAKNEKAIEMVVEGSRCQRWYEPLVSSGSSLGTAGWAWHAGPRDEFLSFLCCRAMWHRHEGDLDAAWADLLAGYRLWRLIDQWPPSFDIVNRRGGESRILSAMEVLLGHESLSSAQIAAMRADLDRLPPTLAMADKVDVFERSRSLEYASDIVRNETYRFINDVGGEAKDSIINGFLRKGVHWNQTLRAVNSWYDNYVDAWRKPTRAERIDATKKSRDEQGKTGTRFRSWASPILPAIAALSKDAPGYVYDPVPLALVHDSEIEDTLDDLTMQFELTKLAFALAAYHADNGAFPEKLADLVPKYVADVPKDIFNDADLHYQLEGDGYLLYSVGLNGIDDGGKTNCDDITVHIAAVKSKTTVPEKESIAPTD